MERLVALGVALIFAGILAIMAGSLGTAGGGKFAVGGFIGPIPFGFGNDPRLVAFTIALTLLLFLFFILRGVWK